MKSFIVKKEIAIHAEPAVVWDALTNPAKTKHYFFNCKVFSDWEPGSDITFKGRMLFFFKIEMKGTILKADPGKLLQYRLDNKGGSHSVVTDELRYNNGITTLTITDDVGDGEGAETRYKRSQKGWDKILSNLKAFIEKG